MTRPTLALRASLVAVCSLVAILVLTPVGVWFVTGVARIYAGSQGWRVEVRHHEGTLASTARLGFVTLHHESLGLEIEVAEIVLAPWSWKLALQGPRVRWTVTTDTVTEPAAADELLRLPVSDLPTIDIVDGAFWLQVPADSLTIDIPAIAATLTPDGERALLDLTFGAWSLHSGSTHFAGQTRTEWALQAAAVTLRECFARVSGDDVEGTFRGTAVVDLTSGFDLQSSFTIEGEAGDLQESWLDVTASGSLLPLALRGTANGAARHVDYGPVALEVTGGVDSAAVRADSMRLRFVDGQIDGQLVWDIAGSSLQGKALMDSLQLEPLTSGALAGRMSGSLQVGGASSNPQIQLELRAPAVAGLAQQPLDLALHASLQEHQLTARASSDRAGLLVAHGPLAMDTGKYDLTLTGELDAAPWLGQPWPLTLQGGLRADTLRLGLQTRRLPFGDDPPGPVRIEAALTAWQHLDLRVAVDADQLVVQARMDLATARVDTLTGSTKGLALASLSRSLSGRLDGQVAASGVLPDSGRASLSVSVDDLVIGGWSLGPTTMTSAFAAGVAAFKAHASGLDLRATIDTTGAARLHADLRDAVVRLQGTQDSVRVSGSITGDAMLQDLASGILQIDIDSLGAAIADWPLRLPEGVQADYADGTAYLSPTKLYTPLGMLQLQGSAARDSLNLIVALDSLETAGIAEVTARGSARLQITGRLDEPEAQLRVAIESLHLGGGSALGQMTLIAGLTDSLRATLDLGARAGAGADAELTVQLSAPAAVFHPLGEPTGNEQARLRIAARGLDISKIIAWALDDTTGFTTSFAADLRIPAAGLLEGFDWREVSGYVELQDLTLTRDRVRLRLDAPARGQMADGTGTLDDFVLPVEMFRRETREFEGAGSIHVSGALTTDGGDLQLRVEDLELLAAARAIPGRISLPEGLLSLQAELMGSLDNLVLNASAHVELEDLGDLSASVLSGAHQWHGSATWVTLVEDSLLVTASAPTAGIWPNWDELTLRARSAGIDLLPLLDQVPDLASLNGFVRLDVTADSLTTNPRVTGQLQVEDLEFALLDVSPGYRFAEGRIEFSERDQGGSHAELLGFSGKTTQGSGALQLTGFFDLLPAGDTDYGIRLTGDNVRFEYEDIFIAPDIDLDLTLRRGPQGPLLEGKVDLTRPHAEIQLVDLAAPPVPPPPTVPNEFLESTRLNVDVRIDGLDTRSELSDITLDGQVRVYGTFYQPRFQGELDIVDGEVIILSRRFTFNRGRIILDRLVPTYSILDLIYDPILLDPELDVEATTSVQVNPYEPAHEVTLTLIGPLRSVTPRLTAPGLGVGEVLSLLAFGQTSSADAEYASAFYTAAGQLLLSRRVEKVGLDEFLLLPSGTALGTVGEPAVRVGKYLSWPVPIWVRYEASTREAASGQFEVEYRITTWMTIDATAYSEYELYGVGVGLSREF